MKNIVENITKIATEAHKGQFRKWTKEQTPYIVHPLRVADKISKLKNTNVDDIAGAIAHDLIEDVAIPQNKVEYYKDLIIKECNETVWNLILELTNPSASPEWDNKPRKEKREKDWAHIRTISDRAKRIKLADRIDNLRDVSFIPTKLLQKYLLESEVLLEICGYVDELLAKELKEAIENGKKYL